MFQADCATHKTADIVAQVISEQTPCFVTAGEELRGVLLVVDDVTTEVVEAHPRVINAKLSDLTGPGGDLKAYCLQITLSDERDAVRFVDDEQKPVLAMVGAERFLAWLEQDAGDEEEDEG